MVRAVIPDHSEHVQRMLMNTVVFDNTRVLTCDAGHAVAEAIAIRAGKVLAVGASDTVRASAGPDSRIIDLNGYTIVPGFIDTHPHLLLFGTLAEPIVDLGDARSHDDIADRLARPDSPPVRLRCHGAMGSCPLGSASRTTSSAAPTATSRSASCRTGQSWTGQRPAIRSSSRRGRRSCRACAP